MNQLTETDKAWLAGVIESDGNIDIQRQGATSRIYVGTGEPLLPEAVRDLIGLGSCGMCRRKSGYIKYEWYVYGKNAYTVCQAIRPYLRCKGDQADILMAFVERQRAWGIRKRTPEEKEARLAMMAAIREKHVYQSTTAHDAYMTRHPNRYTTRRIYGR